MAYLMQHKGACGPHLIIVPNAVMVNWKAELMRWLPAFRCVYFLGSMVPALAEWAADAACLCGHKHACDHADAITNWL